MGKPVPNPAVAAAEKFLRQIPPLSQQRGEGYLQERRVQEVFRVGEGEYKGLVQGSDAEPYEVDFWYTPAKGWDAECSCPMTRSCKHIYAALKSFVSSGLAAEIAVTPAAAPGKAARVAAGGYPPSSLESKLVLALNRGLTPAERQFMAQLRVVHQRCYGIGQVSRWEFANLGFALREHSGDALKTGPRIPNDLHEFWQQIALAAHQQGAQLPEFMLPVTDLEATREKLGRWLREEEIARWNQVLSDADADFAAPAPHREFELRLRLGEHSAELEWRREGQTEFSALRPADRNHLRLLIEEGAVRLSPIAHWLWRLWEENSQAGGSLNFVYAWPPSVEHLARFFRTPGALELVVGSAGAALQQAEAPLRWHLDPPTDAEGDYRLRVVLPDGSPPPPILCVLPGRTALYLTGDAIYEGTAANLPGVVADRENVIPALALETTAGAKLLKKLGVPLPERLAARVRTTRLKMVIRCSLQDRGTEVCQFDARAENAEGDVVDHWTNIGWEPLDRDGFVAKRRGVIEFVDRSSLWNLEPVFAEIGAKWEYFAQAFCVRVTKKFPEQFAAWLAAVPPEIIVKLDGDLASFGHDTVVGQVRLEATESEIDWFDLRVLVDVSDTTLTQEELKLLLNAGGGFVRLPGKGWRKLQFHLGAEENERLAHLGLSPHELNAEPQRLHALQLADVAAKKFLPAEQFDNIQRRVGEIKARVTPEIPAAITAELRPYQTDGFHFLAYLAENRFGGILADDMGLGKTLQTLTWLAWLRERCAAEIAKENPAEGAATRTVPASLVVCPKSVTDNWHAEAERFMSGLRVKVWSASELSGLVENINSADLHVLNYTQLRSVGESLVPVRWLALILDEGQYIKNPSSQTAQIARALHAQHRLVLSGTPIENRLLDLWSLMAFAMPGALGSRAHFAKLYDSKTDAFARRRLSARVRPFLLRRTKSQVAKDLPERIEEDLFCEMDGEQKTLYRAELKRAQQILLKLKTQKHLDKERFNILTSLLRLRQISCHPRLVNAESKAPSAKVEALLEQLDPLMAEGHKVLIFSQFVGMLEMLREVLEPLGHPLFFLAGDTENRGDLVREFQATQGAAIFLISLKAGGFGLNLTAASYVVLFDPWWNPAVENQAIDRTHRIGQIRNVIAYRLLIKDSIEEKIRQMQKKKSALANDVLGEEKFGANLTLEDLQYLFAD